MTLAMSCHRLGLANLRSDVMAPEAIGTDQVRVAIKAVSLNHRDVLVMRGAYGPGLPLPLIPCSDAAGVVTEVGSGAAPLVPGDRVCTHMVPDWQAGRLESQMRLTTLGGPSQGVLCEERVLPRTAVVRIPDSLSFEEAACLPVAGLAAWSALTTETSIGPGTRVLLQGTGGLSLLGLQIAKTLGAEVAVISSSDAKLTRVREMGADFTADSRREGWGELVRRWSDTGVDAVLEVGGGRTFDQSVTATRDGGCIAVLGLRAQDACAVNLPEILLRRIRVQGIFVGSRAELERYVSFVAVNAIKPVIDRAFEGLATARHAFAYLLGGRHMGKIVIRVAS
ncbi:MAG TPA: NAD(P)-dependent alcohol dehydrogenase [Solirubrobacterales bacterium]|jgi:NADPH:quinone reductase-like Zn-dependent oxidoreductase|nr:NAD(P)-dependent alcohol dehydrogenase [Solirubrobacterales bacterium]